MYPLKRLHRRIWGDFTTWPLPEDILQTIYRRHQKTHGRLKRRFIWRTRMGTSGNKDLSSAEGLGKLLAFSVRNSLFQSDQIDFLLFLDMFAQIFHQRCDVRMKACVRDEQFLELSELVFYLGDLC